MAHVAEVRNKKGYAMLTTLSIVLAATAALALLPRSRRAMRAFLLLAILSNVIAA